MKTLREICCSNLDQKPGTYILNLSRLSTNVQQTILAASTTDDQLLLLDIDTKLVENHSARKINFAQINAKASITCMTSIPVYQASPASLVTGGRDGILRIWDTSRSTLQREFRTPNEQGISAIAVHEGQYLAAGTELESEGPGDVAIYIWDLASNASSPIRSYTDSHNDTITSLSFHKFPNPTQAPTQSALYLLSASTDGLLNIVDISQMSEEDAVAVTFNNKAAVNHATPFVTANGTQVVYALSQDEKIAEYEIGDLEVLKMQDETEQPAQRPVEDLRQVFKCDYAIALRTLSGGQSQTDQILTVAVGRYRAETLAQDPSFQKTPSVDIYTRDNTVPAPSSEASILSTFRSTHRLIGAHGEEVVRDIWFDEAANFVVTCGEDGYVRVWAEAGDAQLDVEMGETVADVTENDSTSSKRKRKDRQKNKSAGKEAEKARFRPY